MSVVVLTTGAGAPGASTTALGLALSWAGPTLLVEADPAGTSIVPGWYRGSIDPQPRNIVNLALTEDPDALSGAIFDQAVTLDPAADVERLVLIGLTEPAQAPALQSWWGPIGEAFQTMSAAGYTVIVDAGRLTQGSYPTPLLTIADQVLLVCRGTLSSVLRSYPMALQLRSALASSGNSDTLGLLVIHNNSERYYQPADIAKRYGVSFALSIPDDPVSAATLSDGIPARPPLLTRLRRRRDRSTPDLPTPSPEQDDVTSDGPANDPALGAAGDGEDGETSHDAEGAGEQQVIQARLMRAYRAAAREAAAHVSQRQARLHLEPPA